MGDEDVAALGDQAEHDVAALQDDVVGIDSNLSTAASMTVVESAVTAAIDDLDELAELDF